MNEHKEYYSFEYSDSVDRQISMSFNPGDTWPEVLEQFVSFMSTVYGYNIREQVGIMESPFGVERGLWSGPVFNPEESL